MIHVDGRQGRLDVGFEGHLCVPVPTDTGIRSPPASRQERVRIGEGRERALWSGHPCDEVSPLSRSPCATPSASGRIFLVGGQITASSASCEVTGSTKS